MQIRKPLAILIAVAGFLIGAGVVLAILGALFGAVLWVFATLLPIVVVAAVLYFLFGKKR
ncbi:MAG: hypothetical protein LBS90_08545 [Oscillospiraceae bacterium]|jgi:hypothetical protein|nr:hypothetical protein [Oscillospiraceae bacterium]